MLDAFLALLRGDRPDRIVWTADLTYWLAGQRQARTAKPEWDTEEGLLRLHRQLRILPYYASDPFWAAEPTYGGIELIETKECDKITRKFCTPLGELREESVYSPRSCSVGITKHFVATSGDLDILLHILEHRRLVPTGLAQWPQRRRLWQAYGGLPCIGLPRSPLAAFLVEWAGVQNGSLLLVDCPEKLAEIFRLMEDQEGPVIDEVCRLLPPLVHFPDNLSSQCTTSLYDRWMADSHRRRIDRLHAAGIKCAVHLDGTLKGLLPKLIRSGFDTIEALTPKPGGDLNLEEIRALADPSPVILWGGVPGIMFAPPYTWQQMEAHVRHLLPCWRGHPFIVGVADQVPPDGQIEFCPRIAELIEQAWQEA